MMQSRVLKREFSLVTGVDAWHYNERKDYSSIAILADVGREIISMIEDKEYAIGLRSSAYYPNVFFIDSFSTSKVENQIAMIVFEHDIGTLAFTALKSYLESKKGVEIRIFCEQNLKENISLEDFYENDKN